MMIELKEFSPSIEEKERLLTMKDSLKEEVLTANKAGGF